MKIPILRSEVPANKETGVISGHRFGTGSEETLFLFHTRGVSREHRTIMVACMPLIRLEAPP